MSEDKCIEHTQKGNSFGYGRVFINGKCHYMHRVAYAKHVGLQIEELKGTVIRHKCDNPRCINPAHLLPGTYADNVRDMVERGRMAKPKRKLSSDEVAEIRRLYRPCTGHAPNESVETSQCGLARKFGVDQVTIRRIVLGTSYRDV